MSKVNIGGDVSDPTYRYKRDIIQLEYSSKYGGNYRITNINIICKQLKVNSNEFCKFFYKKISQRGIALLGTDKFKGELTIELAEKVLNDVIQEKLLCPRCKLPELFNRSCKACGYSKSSTAQVDEKEDLDDPICPHDAELVPVVKFMYDKALIASDDLKQQYYCAIDYFWKLPQCIQDGTSPTQCANKHKKWLVNANKMLEFFGEYFDYSKNSSEEVCILDAVEIINSK